MNIPSSKLIQLSLALILIAGLVAALLYIRQRLFTKTKPIVLSS